MGRPDDHRRRAGGDRSDRRRRQRPEARLAGGTDRRRGRDLCQRRRARQDLGPPPRPAASRGTDPRCGRRRAVRRLRCRDQIHHAGVTGTAARVGEPVDPHRDDRRSDRLLRVCPQPPDRQRRRGHRDYLGGRQPRGDLRRHHRLPRPDRLGPAGIAARFLAFCLVIAGAAPMPAPMRATPDAASAAVQPTSGSAAGSG